MTLTMPAFTLHTSFSTILPLYDSFLLDQFGVIHNGSKSLHGAVNCIETMVRENKKLAILSNTSSPSHVALGKLSKYGLRQDMFVGGLVSSGEECSKFVRGKYCSGSAAQTKALWFTWKESEKQSPLEFLQCCENEGNKIGVAECVTEADFILLHGSEVWRRQRELTEDSSTDPIQDLNFMYNQDFSVIDPILKAAAQLNLPMVCANPDLVVTLQGGVKANMPGQIARRYETMRGRVTQFGKPNPSHFISCVKNLGISTEHSKHIPGVAHVGDSLEHDVVGANAAGIDSVFVIGGIHAADLGLGFGFTILEEDQKSTAANSVTKQDLTLRLQRLFGEHGIYPTHVVPSLCLS